MSEVRVLLGSLLVGVGGAVLIAALVLGRGDVAPQLELAAIDDGGVLVGRVEVYRRHGPRADEIEELIASGDLNALPERHVLEGWLLLGTEALMLESVTATWTADGQLLERSRLVGRRTVTERPGVGVVRESTSPAGLGQMQVPPSGFAAESRADVEDRLASGEWELIAPSRAGTLVVTSSRSIAPGEMEAQEVWLRSRVYFADLPVTRLVTEETYSDDYMPVESRRWAILEDGSRVLVESLRFTFEARRIWEWDRFVARVWGE